MILVHILLPDKYHLIRHGHSFGLNLQNKKSKKEMEERLFAYYKYKQDFANAPVAPTVATPQGPAGKSNCQ